MAISGDLRVSATRASHCKLPHRAFLSPPNTKVEFSGFLNGALGTSSNTQKWPTVMLDSCKMRGHSNRISGITGEKQLSSNSVSKEAESFILDAINMTFFERLNLAWTIVFPTPTRKNSNARIAKQRLKMILFSDRCAVSDEAKRKIVNKIVHALSEFVEIESQDKVQLSVMADSDLGTVYSVTVPVRRVKQEYQDREDIGSITNIDTKTRGMFLVQLMSGLTSTFRMIGPGNLRRLEREMILVAGGCQHLSLPSSNLCLGKNNLNISMYILNLCYRFDYPVILQFG